MHTQTDTLGREYAVPYWLWACTLCLTLLQVHYLARRVYKNELDLATYYKTLDALLTVNTRHNMPSWMLHGPLACPHIFDKIKVSVLMRMPHVTTWRK